ncbi:Sulfur carrier protein ThiS [Yersinia pestis biovar Medievalis str. Harbin 35]|uniref:Sulfur transfer protein involved in thiamine biosynthesis n=4 Tax=Yersinia pseudotuberculosis complex TaxID=1649845 RepID=A0A0H2W6F5_YERPE|nr:Sulfur transfer protein involved in thiamine biosynthesis [Yersinia pestis biovar Microtus str. 91001]ADV97231.1 Sulfur carrier protein ThiS [Yersinia pestis biovar Medievalis str. Harbin 35]EEO78475.1 Sulfur carrier protein ThiS [Yersinia pestis Nepal516]EEO79047.1 Sulfur carrier protein ThiS [Yersinia pestis biovar Orientalis str. India 195]EEO85837.1 Sulfur carrier protein ThiS [Yersinia pestis biovar Orientalis str. PEXU2]EEO91188.1 Sulfur carrier protein ThiS [Yersinia pestis Pestoides
MEHPATDKGSPLPGVWRWVVKTNYIPIMLNDQPLEVECNLTAEMLLNQLKHHQPGTALAINQVIIPRADWQNHRLQAGDHILLFQAIAGG